MSTYAVGMRQDPGSSTTCSEIRKYVIIGHFASPWAMGAEKLKKKKNVVEPQFFQYMCFDIKKSAPHGLIILVI